MVNIFQTNAYVKKVTTLADKGLKIELETQELDSQSKATLFDLHDKYAWVAFKEFESGDLKENELDIPETPTEFKGDKTPSQRLRAVIFIYWEQNAKGKEDFDTFYKRQMNKLIEKIKAELE